LRNVAPIWSLVLLAALLQLGAGRNVFLRQLPGGDESHYMIIAHSLAYDGDIDLANNFAAQDWRNFQTYSFSPHRALVKTDRLLSNHGPGFPALIAPAYRLGRRPGIVLLLELLSVLLAWQLHGWLRDLGFSPTAAWGATALFILTPPAIAYGSLVYPEIPGTLLVVLALRALHRIVAGDHRRRWRLLLGLCLGALPWIHLRMSLLAALVLGLLLLHSRRPRMLALPVGLFAAGVAGLITMYALSYGAPLYPLRVGTGFQLATLPRGLLGNLFDRQFGWLVIAPISLLIPVGLGRGRLSGPGRAAALLGLVQLLLVSSWIDWHGGWCPPGRYTIIVLALWLPLVAAALQRGSRTSRLLLLLGAGATSFWLSALWLEAPRRLYQNLNGVNELWSPRPILRHLAIRLPSLWQEPRFWLLPSITLVLLVVLVPLAIRAAQRRSRLLAALSAVVALGALITAPPALRVLAAEHQERLEQAAQPLSSARPRLLAPNEATIARDAPLTFRWEPVPGAEGYRLQIELPDGTRYAVTVDLGRTEYTVSPTIIAAVPAGRYRWRVTPFKGAERGTPSYWSAFVVAD
jgi:hypothetical protein